MEQERVWITKTGVRILIPRMNDGHLHNTLHFLWARRHWLRKLAIDRAPTVQEAERIFQAPLEEILPKFLWLVEEAEARGMSREDWETTIFFDEEYCRPETEKLMELCHG